MAVAAKNAVATAVFSLVLCFGDAAHSQSATPAKILALSEDEAGSVRGPGSLRSAEARPLGLRHCRSEIRSTARKPPRLSATHGQETASPF